MSERVEIGSLWDARDGRVMRVESFGPNQKVSVTVLNASKRMRKRTLIGLELFGFDGCCFLRPYPNGGTP